MFHREQILFAASMLLSRVLNRYKEPRKLSYKRVLFIKLDEIGDVATAMHAWQLFKKQYPSSELTVWCKTFIRNLIKNDPAIDKIIHHKNELKGDYDLIVDLRGNWESLCYSLLHPPKYRLDRATVRYRHRGNQQKEIISNFEIMKPVLAEETELELPLIHTDSGNEFVADNFIRENNLKRFALIHAGARKLLRRWPAHQFAALADELNSRYGMQVVFSGGTDEQDLIAGIQALCRSQTFSFAKGYSLTDFAALAKKAAIFIGNESGPLHIAAACNTPLIGLYGPGVPEVFYPYTSNSQVLHVILECNPCDQVHCVHPDSPCITRISLEEVLSAVERVISS